MPGRKPPAIKKPIVYYNGLFHFIEDNDSKNNEAQYALFQVYNLTVKKLLEMYYFSKKKSRFVIILLSFYIQKSVEEFEHAIIEVIDPVAIDILDDKRSLVERSYIAMDDGTCNAIKV